MSADREGFDLKRLRDDPSEASELRELLVREAGTRVAFDESKGLALLQASISSLAESSSDSSLAESSGSLFSVRRLIGLAILIGGASVGVHLLGSVKEPAPAASLAAGPVTPPPTLALSEPAAPIPVVPVLSVESLPTARVASPPALARSAKPTTSASAATLSDPLEETLHLGALRQMAVTDPEQALTMVEQGNRRFSHGSFREEREAIAVGALSRLGRETEARRAAETFLATYPTSPFASKVRRSGGL